MVSGILKLIENHQIDKIAIAAIDKTNGEVITGYHNCTFADKAVMAANIQATQYMEVYWLMLIKSYRRQRISLTTGMTKTNYKKASCSYCGALFLYPFRPRSTALNCDAIRLSFLGVKERNVFYGIYKKITGSSWSQRGTG